jgi:hypothetical protein
MACSLMEWSVLKNISFVSKQVGTKGVSFIPANKSAPTFCGDTKSDLSIFLQYNRANCFIHSIKAAMSAKYVVGATMHVSCVLLGDGNVGNSTLSCTIELGFFPNEGAPTKNDAFTTSVQVDQQCINLCVEDTAFIGTWEDLRLFPFDYAHVFLICF